MQYSGFPEPEDLDRLTEEAKRLREEAQLLPSGVLRERVLLKARQAQREAEAIKWFRSWAYSPGKAASGGDIIVARDRRAKRK